MKYKELFFISLICFSSLIFFGCESRQCIIVKDPPKTGDSTPLLKIGDEIITDK